MFYIIHNYGEIGYFQALLNVIQVLVGRYFDVFKHVIYAQ